MAARVAKIVREFLHHFPYSAVGVGASLGLLLGLEKMRWMLPPEETFHITHPLHVFLSAIVTAAMFWKYEKNFVKTILISMIAVIPICVISDVLFPYLGGLLFHTSIGFHLCLIEEPWLVLIPCFLGIFFGILLLKGVERLTEFTHLAHVLVSSLASMLYMISFDASLWHNSAFAVFLITVLSVWIPCCLSDIVIPLAFVKGEASPCCGQHH